MCASPALGALQRGQHSRLITAPPRPQTIRGIHPVTLAMLQARWKRHRCSSYRGFSSACQQLWFMSERITARRRDLLQLECRRRLNGSKHRCASLPHTVAHDYYCFILTNCWHCAFLQVSPIPLDWFDWWMTAVHSFVEACSTRSLNMGSPRD